MGVQTSANATSWTPRPGARRRVVSLLTVAAVSAGALLAGAVGGCDRKSDTGVQAYSAPKDTKAPVSPAAAAAGPWDVPEGWKAVPSTAAMRVATYAVSADNPAVVVTVVPLSISPLLPNVNRWANELGMQPFTDANVGTVVHDVDTAAGKATVADLTGPEQSGKPRQQTLAAILPHDGQNWYFKLTGPADVVGPEKPKFEAFVKSVRLGQGEAEHSHAAANAGPPGGGTSAGGELPAGHPPVDAPGVSQGTQGPAAPAAGAGGEAVPGLAKWSAPAGWQRDTNPAAGPMGSMPGVGRSLAFKVGGPDAAAALVTVIRMGANFDPLTNVNRWRGQVGLPAVDAVNDGVIEPVKVGGQDGMLFNIAGQDKQMLVAVVPQNGSMWYFKMVGPSATVGGQKDAMKAFLGSVQFE